MPNQTSQIRKIPIRMKLWHHIDDGNPPETALIVRCPYRRGHLNWAQAGEHSLLEPDDSEDAAIDFRSSQEQPFVCASCWHYLRVDHTYLYCKYGSQGGAK